MFVLLSSITRPGCRDCSRSAAQSEVSHRAKPARPEPPTNRRRTQPTRKPTNRDVVNCHPVQGILASLSLPHRYTPVDHSCSFLCQVLNHVYLELRENSLSLFLEHCDNTQEESITLFTLQCRSECLTQFVCITDNFPTWSNVGYNPPKNLNGTEMVQYDVILWCENKTKGNFYTIRRFCATSICCFSIILVRC